MHCFAKHTWLYPPRGQNSAFMQPLSFFLLLFWAHTNAHMHSNPFQQQDVGQVKTSLHGAFWVSSVPSVTLCWSLSHIRGWLLDAKQQLLSKLCFCFSAILLVSNTFVKISTDCLFGKQPCFSLTWFTAWADFDFWKGIKVALKFLH